MTDSAPDRARALAALKNYRELGMARWPSGPLALETAPAGRRGAAIGHPRTPARGGGRNPLASVRVPCARMVGRDIASSLVNEVEH